MILSCCPQHESHASVLGRDAPPGPARREIRPSGNPLPRFFCRDRDAVRCAKGPVCPWNRKRGRRLRLRTCTTLCPSFLQGPRWVGTCCPSRQFVVVSIYRLQNGIASATAASCHWPDGLRLGCGAAESQHCPITTTWLAGGRRFRQRQSRPPTVEHRSRLWRQRSVVDSRLWRASESLFETVSISSQD